MFRFLVVIVSFTLLAITFGCGGGSGVPKGQEPSLEQLAYMSWNNEFDEAPPPEYVEAFKAAKGKLKPREWRSKFGSTVAAAPPTPPPAAPAAPAAAPPPAVVAPPQPVLSKAQMFGIKEPSVILGGKNRRVETLTDEEWYDFLRDEASRDWNKKSEAAMPPEYEQSYIAHRMAAARGATVTPSGPPRGTIAGMLPEKSVPVSPKPSAAAEPAETSAAATATQPKGPETTSPPPQAVERLANDDSLDRRLKVPSDESLAEATTLVKKLFGDEYEAAKTPMRRPGEKRNANVAIAQVATKLRDFGRKMFAESRKPGLDTAGAFVLMRIARDIAVQTGDVEAGFFITDKMTSEYRIDRPQAFLEIMEKLSHTLRTSQDANIYLQRAIAVNYSFIQSDDFVSSNKILLLSHNVAKRLNRKDLILQIANTRDDVIEQKKQSVEYAEHALRLFQAPEDPNANLGLGKYLCFFKFDWRRGIVLLSRGNDDTLRSLARDELENRDTPLVQAEIADRWWDYSEKLTVPLHQLHIRLHAADLYAVALPRMENSLSRSLAEKRVAAMKKTPRSTLYDLPTTMPAPLPVPSSPDTSSTVATGDVKD